MKSGRHIIFRLDASVVIGTGHLMRCLSLADALRQRGANAAFIMRCDAAGMRDEVQKEMLTRGHACHFLPAPTEGADWRDDAQQTLLCLQDLPRPDCLVVDHYGLDARWENMLRPAVSRVMAIDDLADRLHDCDILLDQNFNDDMTTRYAALVPAYCQQLLGPRFSMLRPEFIAARANARERDGAVRRLAVFFGGTDPGGETVKALTAIDQLRKSSPQFTGLACDVIVGGANPQRALVEQLCDAIPEVYFHCQINDMARVMAAADLCIGAGGTALWERAVLGVPSLVTSVADNQVSASVAMAREGALLYLGSAASLDVEGLQQALAFALGNPWLLISLARRSAELVDGEGLARVVACIDP
ncbi:MAG TPA: UDP-2,4-diacetamido-2,4,6-trideoxy-beta-L-altropyranose hydrolase [Herbaspirillum sp.]|jgi:UDP-2,4-diacetamido-2,4,6-trideoxy-beta-L-altropyranose hydrolase